MLRVARRLLAPCSVCVCCAVYDPSLLALAPEESDEDAGASPGAGARPNGSAGGELSGNSGSIAQGGEAASGDVVVPEPAAGAAGQAASAGSAGMGNSGGGAVVSGGSGGAAPLAFELVDDFETPDVYGLYYNERKPLWYLINDGTSGTQQPLPLEMTALSAGEAATAGSRAALSVACSGFSAWGSGVGVDLLNASGKQPYDLSAYAGISFWAKMPGSYRLVRVNVPDVGTDPSGEICGQGCNDHFGVNLQLSEDWQRHELLFSDMEQVGWGLQRDELTLTAIYSIHFQVAAAKDVELWIDDLGLIVP